MQALRERVQAARSFCDKKSGELQKLSEQRQNLITSLENIEENMDIFEKTSGFLQQVSKHARELAKLGVEDIVTRALQFVFGETYSFKIDIKESRSRPEAEFYVVSRFTGKVLETIPQNSRGGGMTDIVAMALRFALIQVHRPLIDGPIILDEPFKHVSEQYIDNASALLRNMSEQFNRQVILVTHNAKLMDIASKTFRVENQEGISKVREELV